MILVKEDGRYIIYYEIYYVTCYSGYRVEKCDLSKGRWEIYYIL